MDTALWTLNGHLPSFFPFVLPLSFIISIRLLPHLLSTKSLVRECGYDQLWICYVSLLTFAFGVHILSLHRCSFAIVRSFSLFIVHRRVARFVSRFLSSSSALAHSLLALTYALCIIPHL